MSLLTPVKEYLHRSTLKRRMKSHAVSHEFMNLEKAKTIGILYDATQPANSITVTRFAELLKQRRKRVTMLGFVDDRRSEIEIGSPLFNQKDLNWFWLPNHDKVKKFLNKDFDILINAFVSEKLPLEYISALSHARYRVGPYQEGKTHCYELMINLGEKHELQYLLDQIAHYLNVINRDENRDKRNRNGVGNPVRQGQEI